MKKSIHFLALVVWGVAGLLGRPAWAEDIDLFTANPTAATGSGAPILLFAWDNRASFSANASETCLLGTPDVGTSATGPAVATALSGKSGGIEQCAIFTVIQSLAVTATAKLRIGIVALWAPGLKDYQGNDCTNTTAEGGCVIYPVTELNTSTKVDLLTYIKNWTSSGSSLYNIKVNSSAGGPATLMQESWAYLYGKVGLSGRDYASTMPAAGCSKYFVAYVGNNFGSSAKIVADSGTHPWDALSGGSAVVAGMRADPAATSLELTKIRPTALNVTTSCSPPPSISVGQTTDPNGWYADEWTRYMQDQRIKTYTIGLIDNICDNEFAWIMRSMAEYGDGEYFETRNYVEIKKAFETIFSEVQSVNSVFAAVSLPVSVNTQGTYLNQVFVGMFRPDPDSLPRWAGNLKQYKMGYKSNVFQMLDADGGSAISSSGSDFIAECARSFWTPGLTSNEIYWSTYSEPNCLGYDARSNTPDGNLVEKGGQAYMLRALSPASRTVYTCTSGACTALTSFNTTDVTSAAISSNATTRNTLIDWERGNNNGPSTGAGAEVSAVLNGTALTSTDMRPSAHGDVVHSRPVALNFGTDTAPKVVVFYGGNDGVLRAINGNRSDAISASSTSYAAGAELWSFVPPEFYAKIQRRYDNSPLVKTPISTSTTATPKDYGMDGPVVAYYDAAGTDPAWIFASMRRGGRNIYAFSVNRTTLVPTLKWRRGCEGSTCDAGFEAIGQTWGTPKVFKAQGYSTSPLLVVGGGYDATCEDPLSFNGACTSPSTGSTAGAKVQPGAAYTGNRVYILNANDGSLLKTFKTFRGVVGEIFMVTGSDGYAQYGYVADLGGNVYRISGATANTPIGSTAPSAWTMTQIAMLGCDTPVDSSAIAATSGSEAYATHCTSPESRKFLYGVDVAVSGESNYLMIGSGNREQPLNRPATPTSNYFFVIQDKPTDANWVSASGNASACGADNDVLCLNAAVAAMETVGTCLSSTEKTRKILAYRLWATYEQVVTSAITVNGIAYFSTHEPTVPSTTSCTNGLGTARAYALDVLNGSGSGKACGVAPFTLLQAGGLPPSPVAGKVMLDDQSVVPFVIGADGPLQASKIDWGGGALTRPTTKVKSYWYIQK